MTAGLGYIGIVGGPDVCSEAYQLAHYSTPGGYGIVGFENSPYGLTYNPFLTPSPPQFVPYLIDPATLDVELRPDLAVAMPIGDNASYPDLVLDDSTMIIHVIRTTPTFSASLCVVTRSGINIAVSGEQHSVAWSNATPLCRIDDTHFVRWYRPITPAIPGTSLLQTFSVSGGTITLIHTDTIGPNTSSLATQDPTGAPVGFDWSNIAPFHYDGSGMLYCYTEAGTFGNVSIIAGAYSIGGGFGAGLGGTTGHQSPNRVLEVGNGSFNHGPGKVGSSECIVGVQNGELSVFYDDGTHLHAPGIVSGASTPPPADALFDIGAAFINHNGNLANGDTTLGDYLAAEVFDPLAEATGLPMLVSQSGVTLTYTPIAPVFRCPADGLSGPAPISIGYNGGGARHGSNLGAILIGGQGGVLLAYKW